MTAALTAEQRRRAAIADAWLREESLATNRIIAAALFVRTEMPEAWRMTQRLYPKAEERFGYRLVIAENVLELRRRAS